MVGSLSQKSQNTLALLMARIRKETAQLVYLALFIISIWPYSMNEVGGVG